jgi:N-acetylglutamate synthase-like GNAT family acetyltransferase
MTEQIVILPFKAKDQDEVKNLILTGLAEHWGQLDPTKNRDLNDIEANYARDIFLVAWLEGKIIGTGALVHRSDAMGEIVRMSVLKEYRRRGVGKQLLQVLLKNAEEKGYQKIILETTKTWHEVIEFYLQCGFRITHEREGDTFFEMLLQGS